MFDRISEPAGRIASDQLFWLADQARHLQMLSERVLKCNGRKGKQPARSATQHARSKRVFHSLAKSKQNKSTDVHTGAEATARVM